MQASKLVSDWSMHWSRDMLLKKPLLLSSLWQTRVVFVLDSIVNIFAVHFSALLGQSIKVYLDCLYFLVILQEMNSVWIFSALTHFSFSMFLLYFFGVGPKLHVQSTINSRKKVLTKAIWAGKKMGRFLADYSRVHKSSDSFFSKILEKPSIVQKKMIPHIKGLDFSQR